MRTRLTLKVAGWLGAAAAVAEQYRARGAAARAALEEGALAEHFIAREFAAAERGRRLAVVLFGLDDADAFAALHGPAAAEAAVEAFGGVLKRSTRRMNLSARYGWRGDTFLSVLADADATAAETYVTRIREQAEASGVPMPPITAGIAIYSSAMRSPEELVEAAERALAAARAAAAPGP